ncbi:MAG: TrmB family transcriptional regulator [Candidatus Staskawiczbacteria bacterium]|nr:TrmB family transcriptional regulator [Candidatus Staskawiczbacteria bacterium]
MDNNLEIELQRVGLDERGAKVYLAALELGSSPVQKIAARAGIPRATVYLVLNDLQGKGLITTYDEGKKTFFVAESPSQLELLVEKKEAEFKMQKDVIKNLIPELISRGQFEKGERPMVKYYEGPDAVKSWLKDNLSGQKGEIIGIAHYDRANATLQKVKFSFDEMQALREKYKAKSRVIYTASKGPVEGYSTKDRQVKFVSPDKYPFEADIVIRGSRVFFAPYNVPLRGVAIEDKAIANTMKMVFEALWDNLS